MNHCCREGAALLAATLVLPWCVHAQATVERGSVPAAAELLLDVPFVPQSEALCGGAALAMVLRYHGETDVYAEDFAALVVGTGAGIRTTDLTAAARAYGMRAAPFVAQRDVVRALLAAHRPVIALIENRPGVYHYVVLLAWADGRVLFHDPAIGPHRVMTEAELLRAWAPTGNWALLVVAPAVDSRAPSTRPERPAPLRTGALPSRTGALPSPDACSARLADAARAAGADELTAVEHALAAAELVCASEGDVARERAGLRFRQQRYAEAAALAQDLVARDSADAYAWELLAASRFVLDDPVGALNAWNRVGRPARDLARVDGLRRTPYAVVEDAIDIAPGALVTSAALARARRRVSALPTVARARVDYRPAEPGAVHIDAAILERQLLPLGWPDIVVHGARAASDARIRVELANALRAGELWRIEGSWQHNRRGIEIGVSAPDAFGMRAVTSLDGGVNSASFAGATAGAALVRTTHGRVALGVSDWATGALRWLAGTSLDHWDGRATYGGALGGVEFRTAADRIALNGVVDGWWAPHNNDRFARGRVQATLRTRAPAVAPETQQYEALLVVGAQTTSRSAPRDLWSGAGTGRGARALLRAHPLVDDDGVIRGRFWAPSLLHATLELRRWFASIGPVRIGAAAFVDAAVASGGPAALGDARSAVDAGGGLRLALPGMDTTLRLDAAHGLSDGAAALSIGWDVRDRL